MGDTTITQDLYISLDTSQMRNSGTITFDPLGDGSLFFGVGFTQVFWAAYQEGEGRIVLYHLLVTPRKKSKGSLGRLQLGLLNRELDRAWQIAKNHLRSLGWVPFDVYNTVRQQYEERWIRSEDLERALALRETYKKEGVLV